MRQNTQIVWSLTLFSIISSLILFLMPSSANAALPDISIKTLELPVPPEPPPLIRRPKAGLPCPTWVHDAYVALAPDGNLYSTWHPTVDPKYGCTFDHEHGMDPRTWDYFSEVGFPPFSYVNAVEGDRVEDHVGNKVFVVNNDNGCSVMSKIHQGTHSHDAFQNNLHELQHHVRCTDGRRIDAFVLASFGHSGEFKRGCINGLFGNVSNEQVIRIGAPTNDLTSGQRLIPGPECYAGLPDIPYEAWQAGVTITRNGWFPLAYFDPIFAVFNPARYHEPNRPNALWRSVDRCREIQNWFILPECAQARDNPLMTWDSLISTYKGERREWYVGQKVIFTDNAETVWYSDPYGRNAQTTPFEGSVPIVVSATANYTIDNYRALNRDFNNGGPGVRSPN